MARRTDEAGEGLTIRPYGMDGAEDEDAVVGLSLRAWEPVFASVERVLGAEINTRLHGNDWRRHQEADIRRVLAQPGINTWVAEFDQRVVGFVSAGVVDERRQIGEVAMLAVALEYQGHGIGTALTDRATIWLRESGMRVAFIATGGDSGHAAARRIYEKAGYTLLPSAQFYKAL